MWFGLPFGWSETQNKKGIRVLLGNLDKETHGGGPPQETQKGGGAEKKNDTPPPPPPWGSFVVERGSGGGVRGRGPDDCANIL